MEGPIRGLVTPLYFRCFRIRFFLFKKMQEKFRFRNDTADRRHPKQPPGMYKTL